MSIVQTFYDSLACDYDKLFLNWEEATKEQATILDKIFSGKGLGKSARVLDCACGIGTQAIGLASVGYTVTASDISDDELAEAKKRAEKNNVSIRFEHADFRNLEDVFSEKFDIIIAMDNALPHMMTRDAMASAIKSITDRLSPGGIFVASIRDYDRLIEEKPPYSPPYIHETESGKRVSFQLWSWQGDCYRLTQYILDDGASLKADKFDCEYRAVKRDELTELLTESGCRSTEWKFPEETGFYQPVVIAIK